MVAALTPRIDRLDLSTVSTPSTDITMLATDPSYLTVTPTADINITLPGSGVVKGRVITLDNQSSTFGATVKSSDGSSFAKIYSPMIVQALVDNPSTKAHWNVIKMTEYLYTTGTWDADDSTMGYNAAGVTMGGTLSTGRAKTLTPLTAIVHGDIFILQVNSDGFGWTFMSDQFPNTNASAGAYCYASAANAITAYFRQYRTGTTNWGSSMKWRLLKITG